jgi:hypothetical protein
MSAASFDRSVSNVSNRRELVPSGMLCVVIDIQSVVGQNTSLPNISLVFQLQMWYGR